MRALITGISGFVGGYLSKYLDLQGLEVYGTTSQEINISKNSNIRIIYNDLSSEQAIRSLLEHTKPDHIYHLAGQSNVKQSWENKADTFYTNVNLTLNLLEAVRKSSIANEVKVLTVGSSEEYGKVDAKQIPIKEDTLLQPLNPYGVSKAAVSYFAKQYYQAYGLKVVHVRPFNHIGPGQKLGFVVPDFAAQIIKIENKEHENIIHVGNLDSQRDFTDVRDIVRAYYLLLHSLSAFGDVYNVCSGAPVTISDMLRKLIAQSSQEIIIKVDLDKLRPIDVPVYFGDNRKIKEMTGWVPRYLLEDTLLDVFNHLRNIQGGSYDV